MLNSYKVLGIGADATPAQVRLAYIQLMKRYHPDAPGSDEASEEIARQVNRAFWTLRDPARRARHDRLLAANSETPLRRVAEVRFSPISPPMPLGRPKPAGRGLGVAVAAAAIFSLGAFAYVQPQRVEALLRQQQGITIVPTAEAEPMRSAETADTPGVETWHIHGAVADLRQIVLENGMRPVEAYSRRCFEELAVAPTYTLLDHCVAFDTAAALVDAPRAQRASRAPNPFFQPAARERRQQESALLVTSDPRLARARRREVEQLTVSAMANYEELSLP